MSRRRWFIILRSIGAALAGYVAIILATTAGFTPLGGLIHLSAPPRVQVLATVVALAAGLLGGMVAAWLGGRSPVWHALGTATFVAAESTLVIGFRPSVDPLWFDLAGAATLIAATVAGGYLWGRLAQRRARRQLNGGGPRPETRRNAA
ncbi:MAG TPA: hypothetical protein VOA80_05710 [Thermoanaerobaculia bacterium]|nr:hypothetical protein [Thermoanaerobaculia bacterium]